MSLKFHLRPNAYLEQPVLKQSLERAWGQALSWLVLKSWGGLWGLLLHQNADVCGYIADSLHRLPDRAQLRSQFLDRHFTLLESRRLFGGLLEMLVFRKAKD